MRLQHQSVTGASVRPVSGRDRIGEILLDVGVEVGKRWLEGAEVGMLVVWVEGVVSVEVEVDDVPDRDVVFRVDAGDEDESASADTRADHRVVDDPPVVDGRWLFAPRAGARIGALSRVGGVTWDDRSSGDAKTLVEPPRHAVARDTRADRLRAVASLVVYQALQY